MPFRRAFRHLLLGGVAIAALAQVPPAFAQTAPALSYVQPVPQSSVAQVQNKLRQAGVYNGRVDGVWGPDSQAALEKFQQTHQIQVTGQLNQATVATLGLDPNTLLNPQANAETVPPASELRPASIRAGQNRLRMLGFYTGGVDGIWGEGTQSALERFQQSRGLQPSGQLYPATISALGLAPSAMNYR